MHTASYEFLIKPKESARCHQTLSVWVGSGDETSWPLDPDSSHHILCTSPTTHTKATTTTPFPPGSHTLPWIYQDHENRQQTAFQPTCLIKQAICTPPLVMFRHPRTWGTFWSTKFWSFFLFFFIMSEWCSFILTYREFLFSLAYCTLQRLRFFFLSCMRCCSSWCGFSSL